MFICFTYFSLSGAKWTQDEYWASSCPCPRRWPCPRPPTCPGVARSWCWGTWSWRCPGSCSVGTSSAGGQLTARPLAAKGITKTTIFGNPVPSLITDYAIFTLMPFFSKVSTFLTMASLSSLSMNVTATAASFERLLGTSLISMLVIVSSLFRSSFSLITSLRISNKSSSFCL